MHTSLALVAAAALLLVPSDDAQAQLGGFIKRKAAEKIAEKTVDKAAEKVAGKDTTAAAGTQPDAPARGRGGHAIARRAQTMPATEPLDASTLDATLRGLEAMTTGLREADSLQRIVRTTSVGQAELREASRYSRELEERQRCYDPFFEGLDHQRLQAAARAMAHPSTPVERIHRFENAKIELDRQRAELEQRGDLAGRRRLVRDFLRTWSTIRVDARADSAAAATECGALPTLSESARTAARADSLRTRARALESGAVQAGVTASGLPADRFGLARERLFLWLTNNPSAGWSAGERALLEQRRDALERVRRAVVGGEAPGG